jgi:hypothetical protein
VQHAVIQRVGIARAADRQREGQGEEEPADRVPPLTDRDDDAHGRRTEQGRPVHGCL